MKWSIIFLLLCLIEFLKADITTDLVANYQFNGNANDSSSNSIHGNIFGVTETADRFGNASSAYYFDGNNDYITIADNDLLDFEQNVSFSISLWIKTTQTDYSRLIMKRNYSGNFYVISKHSSTFIAAGTPSSAFANNYPSNYFSAAHSKSINDGNWHNIVLVRNVSESTIKMYVDKKSDILQADFNYSVSNGAIINIGRYFNGEIDYFEGKLDDIRFYRRALSDSDIEELFNENGWSETQRNLVAFFPFNGNTNDASPNGYHGTNSGATLVNDRFGNPNSAYYFDGISSYIDCGSYAGLNITTALSISCWVKYENYNSGTNIYPSIVSNADYNTYSQSHLWSGYQFGAVNNHPSITPNGRLRFHVLKPSESFSTHSSERYDDDNWHHLVVQFEPETALKIYVDNQLITETQVSIPSFESSHLPLSIGKGFENGINQFFIGTIDDIRIYNRIISESEIDAFYHENNWDETFSDLVAFYPFNGNANDESGNGNNGTVNGAVLDTDRFDNENSSFEFDGYDDYIQISNNTLSLTENITICYWAKNLDFSFTDSYSNYAISKGVPGVEPWFDYVCGLGSALTYFFTIAIDGTLYGVNTAPVADDNFHFITCMYDYDSSSLSIYLDGHLENSIFASGLIDNTNSDFYIGDFNGSSSWHFFKGSIDDIRIYNRVLTDEEILVMYHKNDWMMEPENVIINIINDSVEIIWDPVIGTMSYNVYSSENPNTPIRNWTLEASGVTGTTWSETVTETRKFYCVKAVN